MKLHSRLLEIKTNKGRPHLISLLCSAGIAWVLIHFRSKWLLSQNSVRTYFSHYCSFNTSIWFK